MSAEYEITLHRPDGLRLAILTEFESISLARVTSAVGALSLVVPFQAGRLGYDIRNYQADSRIAIRRRAIGGQWRLVGDTIWLVRTIQLVLADTGEYLMNISAVDAQDLLRRRIVAYDAGSAQAEKSAEADAFIKAIVRENLGSLATDTDRDLSDYLTVAADLPAGTTPSITKAFSRRNVLTILQELCQASAAENTYLAFDIVASDVDQLQFVTFVGQRGIDKRWPDGNPPLVLSPERGNLGRIERLEDYSSEATVVFCGGQGQGADRTVVSVSDADRLAASPFNRIELWRDARNTSDATALQNEAEAVLRGARPKLMYSGQVIEGTARYGVDYGFGDYISADFGGRLLNCRIEAIKIDVSSSGGENIEVELRAELDINL